MLAGAIQDKTVYVYNEGNQDIDITVTSSLDSDVGIVTALPLALGPGEVEPLYITLVAVESAGFGPYDFTIYVSSS
jgi:hypothetical protein